MSEQKPQWRDKSGQVCPSPFAKQQATPRPWRVGGHPRDDSGSNWCEIVTDALPFSPSYIGQAQSQDATLIVTAVNSFDALVDALKEAHKAATVQFHGDIKKETARVVGVIEAALKLARFKELEAFYHD